MHKKIIAFLVIIAMLFSLTACISKEKTDDNTDTTISELPLDPSTTQDTTNGTSHIDESQSETSKEEGTTSETTEPTSKPSSSKPNTSSKPSTPSTSKPNTTKPSTKPSNPTTSEPTTTPQKKPSGTSDRVVVNVEDVPIDKDEIKDIEISTPDIDTEIKVESSHKGISSSSYYQYLQLNSTEKAIYNQLVEAIKSTTNMVKITGYSLSYDKGLSLLQKVIADNPQFFWVSKSTSILYDSKTGNITAFVLYYTDGITTDQTDEYFNVTKTANRNTISNQITAVNNKTKNILKLIPVDASDIEKEKIIHDYIIENLVYDTAAANKDYEYGDTMPHAFDLYGAICEKKAVCEGYTKMFQYLCYAVGINSTQVFGVSGGTNHLWNTVKIDNQWYQIDLTWNDNSLDESTYYGYFNITTNEMKKDHTIDTTVLSVPNCTATKYSFVNYYSLKVTSTSADPENIEFVTENIENNKEEYLIIYDTTNSITQDYLKTYIFHANSTFKKHIKEKGYDFTLELRYKKTGNFIYIPIKHN